MAFFRSASPRTQIKRNGSWSSSYIVPSSNVRLSILNRVIGINASELRPRSPPAPPARCFLGGGRTADGTFGARGLARHRGTLRGAAAGCTPCLPADGQRPRSFIVSDQGSARKLRDEIQNNAGTTATGMIQT